ncbi:glycosyltransferase family 39 protein [Iamia majanohamensis]|uniref:Glycosyltransferase family 39 protein n=1 Tax=Iamia majanohamensis TaxID=467976 RepID=A0AAF0BVR3_9ACTN|nr:glycosyltransferase family 39 protein [Iamia majanohamensis]WCO67328.1 glycosyltransferase family 39 protein [Iamia majanohamensis]
MTDARPDGPAAGSDTDAEPPPVDPRRTRPGRRFLLVLAAIAMVGFGVRAAALATATECRQPSRTDLSAALSGAVPEPGDCVIITDAPVYREQAIENADGHWFQTAELDETGRRQPSALHPPLYATFLTAFTLAGVEDFDALRALASTLGIATVAVSGLFARRLAGDRVGLIAAGLVALHPMVWINDVVLMSESLYALFVPLVAWAGLRFWERRDATSAALLGATIGLAALTRSEAILLVGVVGLPLVLGPLRRWTAARWRQLGALVLAALVVVAPWVGANMVRFHEPTAFTTTAGFSLVFANCDAVYEPGPRLGARSPECLQGARTEYQFQADDDQSDVDAYLFGTAVDTITSRPLDAARAGLARVGRMWGVYRPFETIRAEEYLERRGVGRSELAVVVGWEVMAAGAWGAWLLRRRGLPISPLVGWVVTSTVVAFINLGLHRFRASSDVALCILAAVAIDELVRWWTGERSPAPPGGRDRSTAAADA